jgi:hypothetical protein
MRVKSFIILVPALGADSDISPAPPSLSDPALLASLWANVINIFTAVIYSFS